MAYSLRVRRLQALQGGGLLLVGMLLASAEPLAVPDAKLRAGGGVCVNVLHID
jgi:hypothetical protein